MSMLPATDYRVKGPDGKLMAMPSRCKKSMAGETDINLIVSRFLRAKTVPDNRNLQYYDASALPDLQSSLNVVRIAMDAFNSLPAPVRKEMGNDFANLEPWLKDERNHSNAVKYGLMVEKPKPEPEKVQKVEVVNPVPKA